MSMLYVVKGGLVHARWFQVNQPPSSTDRANIALEVSVRGVVRHFKEEGIKKVYIDPEPGTWEGSTIRPKGCTCKHEHVEINPDDIVFAMV